MSEDASEPPAFSCCSIGIGRWFWVAWESESDARAFTPALATGYEASAARAEAKAAERFGPELKRLPSKWASGYKRGGGSRAENQADERPRSRLSRPVGANRRATGSTRLSFLYAAASREPPDALGHVAMARHRIVKQTARKIHVECEPFDEEAWARRIEEAEGSPAEGSKPRTIAVDRVVLRTEGRFRCRHARRDLTFYDSEEAGIRDVEESLTSKYAWCAVLGVRFPCSLDAIKAAYRRLAIASHPDAGGDAAEFRAIERAYREALAYFDGGSGNDPGAASSLNH